MSDIFISYAREDAPKASMLAAALASEGWSVWWDPDILPGEEWDQVIERELSGARCVVVLWSKTSVNKRWVRTEAREALDRHILIPALIETTHLPVEFRSIQAISLVSWEGARLHRGFQHLLNSVSRLLGEPSPSGGPAMRLRGEDLQPKSKTTAVDEKILKRVVFTIEFSGRPLGTGFSIGRSTLLVTDANVFNGAIHVSRSGVVLQSADRVVITARPMAGREVHAAELVLPPDQAQDVVFFDTTPWSAPPAIGLDHDPVAAGEDVLCVVAVGDSRGIHRGKITGTNGSTTIYGVPSGPAQIGNLLLTDIVTAGGSAGAPLLRRNGALLGVVVAGDHKQSMAVPVSRLWQRLTQARLITQSPS